MGLIKGDLLTASAKYFLRTNEDINIEKDKTKLANKQHIAIDVSQYEDNIL